MIHLKVNINIYSMSSIVNHFHLITNLILRHFSPPLMTEQEKKKEEEKKTSIKGNL